MDDDNIRNVVLGIISEIAPDEDLSGLENDKRIRDQIDLDSMDFLDIVMELRKQYNVEVSEEVEAAVEATEEVVEESAEEVSEESTEEVAEEAEEAEEEAPEQGDAIVA